MWLVYWILILIHVAVLSPARRSLPLVVTLTPDGEDSYYLINQCLLLSRIFNPSLTSRITCMYNAVLRDIVDL